MEKPEVSIIIASYNRAHLIGEMLDSVSKQTFDQWECIIIDDGSNDNTEEIVQAYTQMDDRFQYLLRPKLYQKGLPGARNYGLEVAEGEFIIFFDDDDYAHPQNLEVCIKQLHASGSDFCHYKKISFTKFIPAVEIITEPKGFYNISRDQIEQVVMNKIPLASCTVMWKKSCFENIKFNESLSYAEEWDCYIRILLEGFKGIGIDEILYYNRKHPESNTGEFWSGDETRKASQVRAAGLVMENLKKEKLFSTGLIRYFVQMGVFLKEKPILTDVLEISEANLYVRKKYLMLFRFYPLLVIGHRAKKFLKKKLS